MNDLLENAFPQYAKVASTLKNLKTSENIEKTGVHEQEYISSLKTDFPQDSNNTFHQKKKLGIKQYCSK